MAQKKLNEGKAKTEKQRNRRNKYHIKTDAKQRQQFLGVGWWGVSFSLFVNFYLSFCSAAVDYICEGSDKRQGSVWYYCAQVGWLFGTITQRVVCVYVHGKNKDNS